jgi:hypothetical protein
LASSDLVWGVLARAMVGHFLSAGENGYIYISIYIKQNQVILRVFVNNLYKNQQYDEK